MGCGAEGSWTSFGSEPRALEQQVESLSLGGFWRLQLRDLLRWESWAVQPGAELRLSGPGKTTQLGILSHLCFTRWWTDLLPFKSLPVIVTCSVWLSKAWRGQGAPGPARWVWRPQQTVSVASALGEPGWVNCSDGQNEQLI